ncbi:MAG: hypothetical protein QM753_08785 [Thermomicrobiales bacterium]
MSPTRRQVLAAITGAAAASTLGPVAVIPAATEPPQPETIEGMIIFRSMESHSEFGAKVWIEIDPEDGSVTVSLENICDPDLSTACVYDAGAAEALMTLLADGAELSRQYRARPDVIERAKRYAAKERAYRDERSAA